MSIPRVHYTERQVLRAADLSDEQTYRIALRRRHNDAGHQWGIVFGLALDSSSTLTVQPGMAIDGFGRELILDAPLVLQWDNWGEQHNQDLFDALGSDRAAVWLLYNRGPYSPPIRGYGTRGPDRFTRWIEAPVLRILPYDENVDPRAPDISPVDAAFGPMGNPPDGPEREWPVYLGYIHKDGASRTYMPKGRPYVRLVGEDTTAASRRARMRLADDAIRTCLAVTLPDDKGTLANDRLLITSAGDVKVWGQTNVLADPVNTRPGNFMIAQRKLFDQADIARAGILVDMLVQRSNPLARELWNNLSDELKNKLLSLRGPVTPTLKNELINGLNKAVPNVTIPATRLPGRPFPRLPGIGGLAGFREIPVVRSGQPRALDQSANTKRLLLADELPGIFSADPDANIWRAEFQPLASVPTAAAPWQMYRAVVAKDGKQIHQLRLELAHPGDKGNPRLYTFQIGHYVTTKADPNKYEWVSCLTVLADGTVVIPFGASLSVTGEVLEGPIQADSNDPRFGATILDEGALGVAASEALTLDFKLTNDTGGAVIASNATITNGTKFHCEFTVKNVSKKTVNCVPIYFTLRIANAVKAQGSAGIKFSLFPNGTHTASAGFTADAAGALVLSAVVMGVSSGGQVVQRIGQVQVTVT